MQVLVNGEAVVTVYNNETFLKCVDLHSASSTPTNLVVTASSSQALYNLHMSMDSLSLIYPDIDRDGNPIILGKKS